MLALFTALILTAGHKIAILIVLMFLLLLLFFFFFFFFFFWGGGGGGGDFYVHIWSDHILQYHKPVQSQLAQNAGQELE